MQPDLTLVERLARQQRAVTSIGRHWRQYEGDLERSIQAICETAAYALRIERVSVWFYASDRQAIVCHDLYEATARRHSHGTRLRAVDHPAYFAALESEEIIVAEDALHDPRTREFADFYLLPLGIGAMLDAPIRGAGRATGVLCHEHLGGARKFHDDELSCAVYLASMVSAALELEHRIESEWEGRRMLSLLRAAFEAAGSALLAHDSKGQLTEHNEFATELWRLPAALLKAHDGRALMHHMASLTMDPQHFVSRVRAVAATPTDQSRDLITLIDGRVLESSSQPQRLDGAVVGRVWSYRDITHQKRLEEELRVLSYHDPLTGLANRRSIDETLNRELQRRQRHGGALCIAMLDIDHFKQVNDRFGHPVGDKVLKVLADDLRLRLRATDLVGRWGGEEFIILLPGTTLADAGQLMDQLRVRIARERSGIPSFTVSIGVAEHQAGQSATELVAASDQRLYAAKDGGRNRVEV